ncbi:FAD-dependent monooxygenase [Asanoa iriomotensis]|uniref:FAD-dependent oxidoreductase n=1 Tax=Asanoa iriomotensis TaxID=234613 RepID=A0ABQ4C9T2_9ACTN|nr:FAD-dependent monooxygenase [Asanoa iriomotensis]GIF59539.1 FAD-dependent oxidoreductase [Asanoa iriomotensis]
MVDVVVVGAGPVGLMVAFELARLGVQPVVLEALPAPSLEPKANGIVGCAVPLLHSRGSYAPLGGRGRVPRPAPRFMYGGFPLDLRRLPDNPVYVLPVPQRRLEAVLAASAGVPVRRGHTVSGIAPDASGVTVSVEGPSGAYSLRCAYLVGCDGAHSLVRKAAGIGFPGVSDDGVVSRSAHVVLPRRALTRFTGRLRGPGGPYRPYLFHRTPHGVFSFARFGSGPHLLTTLEWGGSVDETVPMRVGELRSSLRRVLGVEVAFGAPPAAGGPYVLRRSTARQNRVASSYAAGRVLLAGDAAHVVAGFGGPLLNLGLLDAVDLAARLRRGDVSGYDAARRPFAERVLASSAEQSALLAPGPEVDAARSLFAASLRTEAGLRRVADTIAGG